MKNRSPLEILDKLLKLTNAKVVKATPEETRQIQELEEQRIRSEKDAAEMAKVNAKRKREEAILTQARGEVDTLQD